MIRTSAVPKIVSLRQQATTSLVMKNMALALTPEDDEEYFESEMDRRSFKDKLPIAGAALAFFSLPFIVGLIFLYSNN